MLRMTEEDRRVFDARADHEAWSHAHEILEPWVQSARAIGHDELTQIMVKALDDVENEVNRTLDVLEPLLEKRSIENIEDSQLRDTVFGEVLCELFESRDLLLTPAAVEEFASACGCDGEAVVRRMAFTDDSCGPLDGLARDMDLTEGEMKDLANAAAYEECSSYRAESPPA